MFATNFRRDDLDRRPGKPVPFHERPADRPFANHLGNGRNYATNADRSARGAKAKQGDELGPVFGMVRVKSSTHFRKAANLPLFSWEMKDD